MEHDYSCERPRLRFSDGGRLLQLSFARSPASEWNDEHFGGRGGARGRCKGFSFGSRRRMLNKLNTVSVAADLPYFLTMTLPDDVFCDCYGEFTKRGKVWLDRFFKRLLRVCPSACGIWRMEHQSRKSGLFEGKLFPHFHLLVWGLPEREVSPSYIRAREEGETHHEAFVFVPDAQLHLEFLKKAAGSTRPLEKGECLRTGTLHGQEICFQGRPRKVERLCRMMEAVKRSDSMLLSYEPVRNMGFQDWASLAWYNVVESHNVNHLSAGVRVERVKSWGGVRSYASKYVSKVDSEYLGDLELGRSWGIFNLRFMPWAKIVELDLDEETGVQLRRVARRYLERIIGRKRRAPYGITLYCDVERFKGLWESRGPPAPF